MNKKEFFIFLFVFVLSFICCSYLLLSCDRIWNYGFAYNVSRGLVPYRDFNMVVTPLYTFILSFFIKIFGHYVFAMNILNALIISFIIIIMYKKIKNNAFIILPVLFYFTDNGYNFFSVFLVVLLLALYEEDFKFKDFILGIIVGLMILTKQTVGFFVLIPMFFLSKNKFKFMIGVMIFLFLFIIYLLFNGALYNFIDYCFLGMFSFVSKNRYYVLLPYELFFIILLLYLYFSRQVDKSVFIVLFYQIISAPIFDLFHILCGIVVCIYYLFLKFKIHFILKIILFVIFFCLLDGLYVKTLYPDKNSFLYNSSFLADYKSFNNICNEYKKVSDGYDYVFMFSSYAYILKLNLNYTTNKYDLINNGNMGYNGYKKYINEIDDICSSSSCMFIVDSSWIDRLDDEDFNLDTFQINYDIIKYVYDNYDLKYSKYGLEFFSN